MIGLLLQNRYKIEEEIGRGGMGAVYRGYDTLLERSVAVKILNETSLIGEKRTRWLREAQAVARLNHPNIVSVYDAGESELAPFIVMEFIEGTSLRNHSTASFEEIAELGRQICDALEHAHAHGVIHRDLKPENIMITNPPSSEISEVQRVWVKITDFGLARTVTGSRETESEAFIGTLNYLAPEQALDRDVDGRADLYALGVILYELATGQLPFKGDHPGAIIMEHLSKQPVPPTTLRNEVPLPIEAIILRLLEKEPQNRFASAKEAAVALSESSLGSEIIRTRHAKGNLPALLTSFIGRQREIIEISKLLSKARLVTLTGPGGCGKTRLALKVASELQPKFSDGAWLVELAPLVDPGNIPQKVASVFGLLQKQQLSWTEILINHIQDRQILLVLDNCEHLIDECAHLCETILHQCSQVTILASSREALGINGESPFRVPSLSTPDVHRLHPIEELSQFEAVQLFLERVRISLPTFKLTEKNKGSVAEVCHRLDGIPLAIELAAARVALLRVEQVAARLDDCFRLLTGGSRIALPRQQTLKLSMDWSYNLLSQVEKTIFRQLSTFTGGCTLEAAQAVCTDCDGDTLDLLSRLVSCSLVMADREPGHDTRYQMLEIVRQYGRDKLLEAGETEIVRARHLGYYLEMSKRTEPKVIGGRESELMLQRVMVESDNLRAALEWALSGGNVEAGLEMAGFLWPIWYFSSNPVEGRYWLERALSVTSGSVISRARALYSLGILAWQQGEYSESRRLNEQSIVLWREIGDTHGLADATHMGGHVIFDQRDYELARQSFEESLKLYDELGEKELRIPLISDLGLVAYLLGDYHKARDFYQESLYLAGQSNDRGNIAQNFTRLGDLARLDGDYDQAEKLYRECLQIMRELDFKMEIASSLHSLGYVAKHRGEIQKAKILLEESLKLQKEGEHKQGIVECLFALAGLKGEFNQILQSVQLFSAAQSLLDRIGAPLSPADQMEIDRDLESVREKLEPSEFEKAWAQGMALSLEQSLELAIS